MNYTLIIDRIGHTNIFNLFSYKDGEETFIPYNEQLYTIIDDSLIDDYLADLRKIANISQFKASYKGTLFLDELKSAGYIFFQQFFPETLKFFFKTNTNIFLYCYVSSNLASIPIELLYTGTHFLWENFYIGKTIKSKLLSSNKIESKKKINMLIIADPAENLDWARKEGEALYEYLSTEYANSNIKIKLIGGRNIHKLNLLENLVNQDIIHYCGHLHFSDDYQENGWLLYDSKILYSHEIAQSQLETKLVFSNACFSGRSSKTLSQEIHWNNTLVSSFLQYHNSCYIGTNWEIPDEASLLDFTLKFYSSFFDGNSIGQSLHHARQEVQNKYLESLITYSYSLIGNPNTQIFNKKELIIDLDQSIIISSSILNEYPYPIAKAYKKFLDLNKNLSISTDLKVNTEILQSLFQVFYNVISFIACIVSSHTNTEKIHIVYDDVHPYIGNSQILSQIYRLLDELDRMDIKLEISRLKYTLSQHQSTLEKIIYWEESFYSEILSSEQIKTYIITLQYLMDILLLDVEYLKYYGFYYVVNNEFEQINLSGASDLKNLTSILLPTHTDTLSQEIIKEEIDRLKEKCVLFIPYRKIFFDLSTFIDIKIEKTKDNQFLITDCNFQNWY